jgi:hypothetical protein
MARHYDNEIVLGSLGATLLIASFHAVPASSEKVIDLIAAGLVGYLARAGVDAARSAISPKPPEEPKP